MPASEAWRDAPRALRKVRHREAFSDVLGGVAFVAGVAQAGMPEPVVARLVGCGVPLLDLGPWEDAPAPAPAEAAPPSDDAPAPSPLDAPAVAAPSAARPALSPSAPPSRHDRRR